MDNTVKHRFHPLLSQYYSTNTKLTLKKRLSHSMDNSHPENPLTGQRICDQQRVIMIRANTQENIRGAWITRNEIHQLRNDVSREIENERNLQQNEPNNADEVIECEHVDLPHNIIPPEENTIGQPNDVSENDFLKIKEKLVNAYVENIVTPFNKRFQ